MIIRKGYERLVNLGQYENVRVKVEFETETSVKTSEEIKKLSISLGKLAKIVIEEEVANEVANIKPKE